MAEHSSIEWTDATWNPITGCSVVSPGCTNCYAMKLAGGRLQHHPTRQGLTTPSKAGPVWNGQVRLNEGMLTDPLRWRRPRRIFVCAHGDLFHESVPDAWIDQVFAVMALAPHHTFQVLTKRADRMRAYIQSAKVRAPAVNEAIMRFGADVATYDSPRYYAATHAATISWPLPNVWLGVSAEDQARADERIPHLLATPAAVRFLSAEPLLGPISFYRTSDDKMRCSDWLSGQTGTMHPDGPDFDDGPRLDWVIVGGESGPGARPMHPDWARQIRDDCAAAGVALFFKQWGNWREAQEGDVFDTSKGRGANPPAFIVEPTTGAVSCYLADPPDPRARAMLEVGKKAAGRLLDGIEHNAMPEVR